MEALSFVPEKQVTFHRMVPATTGKLCKWMGQEDPVVLFIYQPGAFPRPVVQAFPRSSLDGRAVAAAAPLRPCEFAGGSCSFL